MERAAEAFVALGSNLGDREANLQAALRALASTPGIELLRASSIVETPPIGCPEGSGAFLNSVALLRTPLSARGLLDRLLEIERALGRDRLGQPRNAPRTLDLDLLLYGDEVISEEGLEIPHPRMHLREFVLWPLLQIAPKVRDPRVGEPFADALHRLKVPEPN